MVADRTVVSTELARERMTQLATHIRSHPEEMDMMYWHLAPGSGSLDLQDFGRILKTYGKGPCDSTHCIAGTAQVLFGIEGGYIDIVAALGISWSLDVLEGRGNANRFTDLFYLDSWPEELRDDYVFATTAAGRAEAAAEAVEFFRDRFHAVSA